MPIQLEKAALKGMITFVLKETLLTLQVHSIMEVNVRYCWSIAVSL